MHPFHELLKKETKSDAEKVAVVAIGSIMRCEGYTHKTPEQIYDSMLASASLYNFK